jgi:cytochrome oxidase assembly protein ShyY1
MRFGADAETSASNTPRQKSAFIASWLYAMCPTIPTVHASRGSDSVETVSNPLLRPRWILIHLALATLTATMVFLGFWQLNRLDQKQATNRNVIARTALPPVDVGDLFKSASTSLSFEELQWRVVTAQGTYLADEAVTIINRSQDATAGYSPVTPFLLDNGSVVFVNRGFVPLAQPTPSPTTGSVVLKGYLRTSQTRTLLGAVDSTDPSTVEFHRLDLDLLAQRMDKPTLPMYVQLMEQTPALNSPWPAPTQLPELTEGSHFSYAMQWWFFSLVSLTGWIVVSRRALRTRSSQDVALEQTSV